jgi:hypothetical protein
MRLVLVSHTCPTKSTGKKFEVGLFSKSFNRRNRNVGFNVSTHFFTKHGNRRCGFSDPRFRVAVSQAQF